MAPFGFAAGRSGIGPSTLKTRRANVLGSHLQVAESADEPAATMAAGLKRFVGMKEAGCLVRHCGGRPGVFADDRPRANVHFLPAEGTSLPSVGRRHGIDIAGATGAGDSERAGGRECRSCRGAGRFGTALRKSEQVDVQAHAQPRL